MRRRKFVVFLPAIALCARALLAAGTPLRGKLVQPGGKPALQTPDGRLIPLTGDSDTESVLNDPRLKGTDFEIIGTVSNGAATIDPIHTAAIWAHKDGKRLRITYWCDICAIRTFVPGLCQCCREETVLDLVEPDKVVTK